MEEKEKKQDAKQTTLAGEILRLILKILIIAAVVVVLLTFVFGVKKYDSEDMKPSIKAGDVVLYYRIDKRYKAGDTVIVSYKGEDQVRRVAAIAGDTVDISEDGLTINGSIQQEADIYEDTLPYKKGIKYPVTLKEGEVFLLGDKRSEAVDSRLYGAVKVSDTKGKVMLIIRRWGI